MKAGVLLVALFNVLAVAFLAYVTLGVGNGAAAHNGFVPVLVTPPSEPVKAPLHVDGEFSKPFDAAVARRASGDEQRRLRAEFDEMLAPYRRDELDLRSSTGSRAAPGGHSP